MKSFYFILASSYQSMLFLTLTTSISVAFSYSAMIDLSFSSR